MKLFSCSVAAAVALSTFAVAGGDIAPVEPVVEEVMVAEAPSDSGFYIGGAYSSVDHKTDYYRYYDDGIEKEDIGTAESDYDDYMLLAGYQFSKYLAVEGRYWGSQDNKGTYSETNYVEGSARGDGEGTWDDGEFSAWGIYLKPMLPVGEQFTLYGLLGYGNTQIDGQNLSPEALLDEDGFQWGLGASMALNENVSFFVDYVQLANDVDGSYMSAPDDYVEWETSVYTVNVGVTYKF